MTKAAALHSFFSSFGIPAYERYSVPHYAEYPYLTYGYSEAGFDSETALTVDLWYRCTDNVTINAKAREISERIGRGGETLCCDGGYIWLKCDEPFCQSMSDPNDDTIKRRYINLIAEYLTAY